jgi:serine/threonine protein kinase
MTIAAEVKGKDGEIERRPTVLRTTVENSISSGLASLSVSATGSSKSMSKSKSGVRGGGRSDSKKETESSEPHLTYTAERVTGSGSFGIVYQAQVVETQETVAIKKVLQDRRYKNREVQILKDLRHPDVIRLRHCFYSRGNPDEVFLNLVMDYVPETLHRSIRAHTKASKHIPMLYVKVYAYQLTRAMAYIHSLGVCHRDIKPQNILLDPKSHKVFLCDFGSAKVLTSSQANVAYICSRYYRAPELVFDATYYSTAVDIWSLGCVFAELLLGTPLFPGGSSVDQLVEIMKVLGTPTKDDIRRMNPMSSSFRFPHVKRQEWTDVFKSHVPDAALDLVNNMLSYDPKKRMRALNCLGHPFFDELRAEGTVLPNGKPLPPLFNWTKAEISRMERKGLTDKLVPKHMRAEFDANLAASNTPSP